MARRKRPDRPQIKTDAELLRFGRIEISLFGKRKYVGAVVLSAGGLRWYPARAKRPRKVTWTDLATLQE